MFERALEQEQEVSHQIDALYETAFNEKAFAAVAELQWFLTEQVEEEKTGREIVTKLKMVGSDPASLLDMDRELGARTGVDAPPAPSAVDLNSSSNSKVSRDSFGVGSGLGN